MKKALISSVLFGVLAAGSAMAADLPVKAPIMKAPPPPVYNWTGCYLGGGGGYGMFDHEHDSFTLTGVPIGPRVDTGGRGWFGTVQGGCDIQFNSFLPMLGGSMVFGVFADGDWGSIKGTSEISNTSFFGDEKEDQSWAVGGRLGWLPTDRFLTFVSGGFTQAHLQDINFVTIPLGFADVLPAHRNDGWFIGTGYEYNLGWWQGLTWKTEYRWADYRSQTDGIVTLGGAPAFNSNSHLFVQTIRSELVWRFNWGGWGGAPVMSRY
jgi:outer membrane immunogenic protein